MPSLLFCGLSTVAVSERAWYNFIRSTSLNASTPLATSSTLGSGAASNEKREREES